MEENQSISKRREMDHQADQDLLSDLPLCIVHSILERVPIRVAIKMSILSRQWRHIWTSLPQFAFREYTEESSESKYEEFIASALIHLKGPIHKFTISCPIRLENIDGWLLHLSRNDSTSGFFKIHDSIYSCKNLTHLDLFMCELVVPPPSTFKGFLFLKSLILRNISPSSHKIESRASFCPLLERFELMYFEESERNINVSAPKLKYFLLIGYYIEVCIYAPLLTELSVDLCDNDFSAKDEHYTNFLGGFTDLEKLNGSSYFIKYLSICIESYHHSLVFHRLKLIELEVDLQEAKDISAVARLVIGSPNLHELKITNVSLDYRYDEPLTEAPHLSSRDFAFAQTSKLEKLRFIHMIDLSCLTLEMEFLRFLLESSPMLEIMSLYRDEYNLQEIAPNELQSSQSSHDAEKNEKLSAELLGWSWASPTAKIYIS